MTTTSVPRRQPRSTPGPRSKPARSWVAGAQTPSRRSAGARFASTLLKAGLTISLLGAGLVAYLLLNRSALATLDQTVQAGGVSLQILETEWIGHDHGAHEHPEDEELDQQIEELTQQGVVYPMPSTMMPDMPEQGQIRIQIEVNLENLGSHPREFALDDFILRSASGDQWLPRTGNSISYGTLGPAQAINGKVAFDVEDTATDLYLVWSRGGTEVRFPMDDASEHVDH